jgi:predicted dehydrogenase
LGERSNPEAVLICTPPVSHAEICLHFIERKVPVLCEKPFALNVTDTVRVLEAAQRNRVAITMASKFRYVPDVVEAKRIVDSGILGDIILFENAFASRVDMSNRWNSNPAISGGGVLIDNGTHSLDLARHFLGPLAEVLAIEGPRRRGLGVEDTVSVFVRSRNGVIGTIDLSWTINKELDRYISIFGSRGALLVEWKGSKYRQLDARGWVAFGSGYDKIDAFRAQLTNFARAIRGKERLLVGPEDILGSVRVVEAAYESLRRSHWTPVNDDEPNLV